MSLSIVDDDEEDTEVIDPLFAPIAHGLSRTVARETAVHRMDAITATTDASESYMNRNVPGIIRASEDLEASISAFMTKLVGMEKGKERVK
jgi:transcription termination factor NusB